MWINIYNGLGTLRWNNLKLAISFDLNSASRLDRKVVPIMYIILFVSCNKCCCTLTVFGHVRAHTFSHCYLFLSYLGQVKSWIELLSEFSAKIIRLIFRSFFLSEFSSLWEQHSMNDFFMVLTGRRWTELCIVFIFYHLIPIIFCTKE